MLYLTLGQSLLYQKSRLTRMLYLTLGQSLLYQKSRLTRMLYLTLGQSLLYQKSRLMLYPLVKVYYTKKVDLHACFT